MNIGIIVAGGRSARMGAGLDKAFMNLGAKPVLVYSLEAFEKCAAIDAVVLVVRKDRLAAAEGMVQVFGFSKVKDIVAGGAQRQVSVANGLAAAGDEARLVCVHDGSRPCVTPELIGDTIKTARRYGSGVAAVKIVDTVKEVSGSGLVVSKTLDRSRLWAVQTPQTFKVALLRDALETVRKKKVAVTDDASAVEMAGGEVRLVPSSWSNIKITLPEDLALVETLLKL